MGPWRSTVMASLVSGSSLGSPTLSALTDPTALDALARDFSTEAPVLAAGLAHRVDQLRGLEQAAGDVEALGHETMDLLAPLADRLGMSRWRAALEDASFAVVAPVDHASLTAHLHADPVADQARVDDLMAQMRGILGQLGLEGAVTGRVKSLYSVHRKMQRKGVPASAIVDRLALRVQVETEADCYALFAAAQARFGVLDHETDDYIAHPKPNGYRSLHTAMVEPGVPEPFELQVRTFAMHEHAERGTAAHWRYKLAV